MSQGAPWLYDTTLKNSTLHSCRLALADVVGTSVLLAAAEAALGLQPARGASDGNRLAALVGAAARGAWAAVQECRHNAQRPAVTTALLDAVLMPSLFDCAAEDTAQRWAPSCSGKIALHGTRCMVVQKNAKKQELQLAGCRSWQ